MRPCQYPSTADTARNQRCERTKTPDNTALVIVRSDGKHVRVIGAKPLDCNTTADLDSHAGARILHRGRIEAQLHTSAKRLAKDSECVSLAALKFERMVREGGACGGPRQQQGGRRAYSARHV
jgi:hypothetical protein